MTADLAQLAVTQALSGDWQGAISTNEQLLSTSPDDTDALNRLARANYEVGKVPKAISLVKKVLKIDPFNTIAKKSLGRWEALAKSPKTTQSNGHGQTTIMPGFLEEPGKTKSVNLMHLGSDALLSELNSGDEVKLGLAGHRINILTNDNRLIGRLSDDISARIKHLVGAGNEYKVFIKSVQFDAHHKPEAVCVFIKETKKSPKLSDVPSFSSERIDYIAFTSPTTNKDVDEFVAED